MSIPQETIDLVWNRALELDSPTTPRHPATAHCTRSWCSTARS
ncbi:hypothetical protein [Microbacterium sp. NIBRBAC000506063]|nr:hypothetical protein [Microbacterium sp. NIBRBAC000506063]